MTNNICETIHNKISNFIANKPSSKYTFRDIINFVINEYAYNNNKSIRRDYITRTIIIIIEKYELNSIPIFIL